MRHQAIRIKAIVVTLSLINLFGCNVLESNNKPLDNQSLSSTSISSAQRSIFQLEDFPKDACGDSLPANRDSSVTLYPIFISYSESNLQKIKSSFCKDAFAKEREDTGEESIQVASFISQKRAEQFSEFMREHLGSGEVGIPIRLIASIKGFPKDVCGDAIAADSQPATLYPVFIDYSESNLLTVQLNFCRDAFPTVQEDADKQSIQVASFTTREKAESFKNLMQEHLGSGEIGETSRIGGEPSPEPTFQPDTNIIKDLEAEGLAVVLPSYVPNGFRVTQFTPDIDTRRSNYEATYQGPNSCEISIRGATGGWGGGGEKIQTVETQLFGQITLEEIIYRNNESSRPRQLMADITQPEFPVKGFPKSGYAMSFSCQESLFDPEEATRILQSLRVLNSH